MTKGKKIILITSGLLALTTASIVYATVNLNSSQDQTAITEKVSATSISKSSNILKELNVSSDNLKTTVIYDELKDENVYSIENANYLINMDTNNDLIGIYTKQISTTQEISSMDSSSAKDYILDKYKKLNLPSDYELNYLEKFDYLIWQANFEKNYNGIYNKYESVKVFFIPDTDEIVSLTVFNEPAASNETTITQEEATLTATENLGISSSDIVSATLTMEKANDYYDNSNKDTSIRPTWVIQSSDNSIIYIDAENNKVIGGDCINE